MTSRNQRSKVKKPLETTLGQAPNPSELDLAHLRKPLQTSLFGLRQILSLYNTATDEVQDYITYECEVLYECRICRTIFRSLANFILHKRNYCKEKFHRNIYKDEDENTGSFLVDLSEGKSRSTTPDFDKKAISPVIDKLRKRQEISQLAKDILNEDLSNNPDNDVVLVENDVCLERIDSTKFAVFQSAFNYGEKNNQLIKSEVMEIHGIFESNEAVLDADGKICNFETEKRNVRSNIPKSNLICTECDLKFSTKKTLTSHIKYKHNKTCIVYPCPDCKDTFANAWCVYRHLYKVHRRTTAQVRKLRTQIHLSAIRKDQQEPTILKKVEKIEEQDEVQWLNNVEGDNDLQMCGGCGKRFERKAALHSHSQMCLKRIAVCNTIRGISKKNQDKKSNKVEEGKSVFVECLKGSAKRKPRKVTKVTEKFDDKKNEKSCDILAAKEEEILDVSSDESCILIEDNVKVEIREDKPKLKRKRANSCDFYLNQEKKTKLLDFNEEVGESFIAKATPFMIKDELKCNCCQLCFSSFYQLLWHMSLHFSWFRFQCSKCSFISFNKNDCISHVLTVHKISNSLLNSIVLPIPMWKTVSMAHEFKVLDELKKENDEKVILEDVRSEKTPKIEQEPKCEEEEGKVEEIIKPKENGLIELPKTDEENSVTDLPNSIIVIDSNNASSENSSSPEDVKFGPGPSRIRNRPIRTRTKSVKTLQDDFIYDLNKVLKLNDNSIKNSRARKISTEKRNFKSYDKNIMKDL